MEDRLFVVKYKIINFTFKIYKDSYIEFEPREEIVSDIGLARIKADESDNMTIIESIKPLDKRLYPKMIRLIEYVDKEGKHKGTVCKPRFPEDENTGSEGSN